MDDERKIAAARSLVAREVLTAYSENLRAAGFTSQAQLVANYVRDQYRERSASLICTDPRIEPYSFHIFASVVGADYEMQFACPPEFAGAITKNAMMIVSAIDGVWAEWRAINIGGAIAPEIAPEKLLVGAQFTRHWFPNDKFRVGVVVMPKK